MASEQAYREVARHFVCVCVCRGHGFSQMVLVLKNSTANAGDMRDAGLIPES